MTKASGTAAELLNLPSGGGSVSGQGGDFSVDLNTGTATAKFDFTLPAGRTASSPRSRCSTRPAPAMARSASDGRWA